MPHKTAINAALDRTYLALGDTRRRRILELLATGPRRAGDLAAEFPDISRIAVRKHLAVLEGAKLVTAAAQGRERWYHSTPQPLIGATNWMAHYTQHWQAKLQELETLLNED